MLQGMCHMGNNRDFAASRGKQDRRVAVPDPKTKSEQCKLQLWRQAMLAICTVPGYRPFVPAGR